jgi:hypothetical protein
MIYMMFVFKYYDEKQFLLDKYQFYSLLMSTVYHFQFFQPPTPYTPSLLQD